MTCRLCHNSKRVPELRPNPKGPKHKSLSALVPCPRCAKREHAWMAAMEHVS